MMMLHDSVAWWSISAAVSGFGMALLYPNLSAAIADQTPPEWRGTAIGIYRFWRDLGYGIGALGLGITAHYTGSVDAAFWFVAITMFLSGGLLGIINPVSYRSAIEHFEVCWGGFLRATSDMVARYLADYAAALSANTFKLRLAALSQWHLDQGMPDPTKAPVVKKVLKGIRALHPAQENQAKPLQLEQLKHVACWLDDQIAIAVGMGDRKAQLKHTRDRAILLLGFWRGFRSDELSRLDVDFMQLTPNEGLELFLPFSKGDRESRGEVFKVPALAKMLGLRLSMLRHRRNYHGVN